MDIDAILGEEFAALDTVEVEGLLFDRPRAVEALLRAGRLDAAEAFRTRSPLAVAWDVVSLALASDTLVPALLEYICPRCATRYHASSLHLTRAPDPQAGPVYSATCRFGHLLPWLYRRRAR